MRGSAVFLSTLLLLTDISPTPPRLWVDARCLIFVLCALEFGELRKFDLGGMREGSANCLMVL